MKKIKLFVTSLLVMLMSFAMLGPSGEMQAARVGAGDGRTRAAGPGVCSDNILYPGDMAAFIYQTGTGPTAYQNIQFSVTGVNVSNQTVYNPEIGAWIPTYPLKEVGAGADQILKVGEWFYFPTMELYPMTGGFRIFDVNTANNTVEVQMETSSNYTSFIWIKADYLLEVRIHERGFTLC